MKRFWQLLTVLLLGVLAVAGVVASGCEVEGAEAELLRQAPFTSRYPAVEEMMKGGGLFLSPFIAPSAGRASR